MLRKLEDPAHDALAFFGRDFIQCLAASNGDQHEETPAHDRETGAEEFVNRGQIVSCFLRDQRVDLNRKTERTTVASGGDGAIECSRNRADVVMLLGARAVEAQAEALDAMLFQLRNSIVRQFGCGARSDGDFEAEPVGVVNEFVDVAAAEWIAAGQDQMGEGITKIDQLPEEALAFFCIKFERIRRGHCLGAAVLAGKATGLGHLPVAQQWIFGEIMGHVTHFWSSASYDCHDEPPSANGYERTPTSILRVVLALRNGCDFSHRQT